MNLSKHKYNDDINRRLECADNKTIICGGQPEGALRNDGRLITAVDPISERTYYFFRSTLNVCVFPIDCDRNDPRQSNISKEQYVLIHGLIHTCDGRLAHEKCTLYPNKDDGQTVEELYGEVMDLLEAGECW